MVKETAARIVQCTVLFFISYQTIMLRRILYSRAWTLLVLGFVVFFALGLTALLTDTQPHVRVFVSVFGYALIALGFHLLHLDLLRILKPRAPDARTRSDDPQSVKGDVA